MPLYLDMVNLLSDLPLVDDIKFLIKMYLIPPPPVYGEGIIKGPFYYIDSFMGDKWVISDQADLYDSHKSYFNYWSTLNFYSPSRGDNYDDRPQTICHSLCKHYTTYPNVHSHPSFSKEYPLCYWCRLEIEKICVERKRRSFFFDKK